MKNKRRKEEVKKNSSKKPKDMIDEPGEKKANRAVCGGVEAFFLKKWQKRQGKQLYSQIKSKIKFKRSQQHQPVVQYCCAM